jgi:hypothetical protein
MKQFWKTYFNDTENHIIKLICLVILVGIGLLVSKHYNWVIPFCLGYILCDPMWYYNGSYQNRKNS